MLLQIDRTKFLHLKIEHATTSIADPDPNPDPPDQHVFGLLDPDPLVRGMAPDPFITKQK